MTTKIIVFGVFGLFILLVIVLYIRRREMVFEGEVIDKNVVENQVHNTQPMNQGITIGNNMNGGVTHSYTIKVKTDAGKTIGYPISSGMYEVIKIGDRVSKPKGTTEVTIVSSKTNVTNPPQGIAGQPPAPTPPTQTFV